MGFLEFFMISSLADRDSGFSKKSNKRGKKVKSAYLKKNKWNEYEIIAIVNGKENVLSRTKDLEVAENTLKWVKTQ